MINYKITYKISDVSYVLYDSLSEDPDKKVLSASLSREDNNAGSLPIELPPSHPLNNIIQMNEGSVYVYEDSVCIWSGRCTSKSYDFFNQGSFEFEGALAYLNDTHQESIVYHNYTIEQFVTALLAVHNGKVNPNRRILVGNIEVSDGTKDRYSEYEVTLEALNDLVTDNGGHFSLRYSNDNIYLDYLSDYNDVNSQYINFGENLLDFSSNYSIEEFATVIFPLGKEDENGNRLTVESVNQGSKYVVNSDAVALYGWIEKMYDDSSIETASVLLSNAQQLLAASIVQNIELNVSAIDLHMLDTNIAKIKLLDTVRVISRPNGVDMVMPVKSMEIDLCNPANNTFSLGETAVTSISTRTSNTSGEIKKAIENLPSEADILDDARAQATSLITSATTGYVTTRPNEILISDNEDYLSAQKIWRWNLNGLGYSSTGYNGTFGTAITMNGAIVADYITTGTMSAARISGGSLTSQNNNTSWNLNDGTFTMRKGTIGLGNNFYIDENGDIRSGASGGSFSYISSTGAMYFGPNLNTSDANGSWTGGIVGSVALSIPTFGIVNGLHLETRTTKDDDLDDGVLAITSAYLAIRRDTSGGFFPTMPICDVTVYYNGVQTGIRFMNGIMVSQLS